MRAKDAAARVSQTAETLARVDDPDLRTPLLRELAHATIDLRECFLTDDGEPDYRGTTYAYRLALREAYASSGLSREHLARVQNSVRHHVGVELRNRLDAEQLEAIGLLVTDPAERGRESRAKRSTLTRASHGALVEREDALSVLEQTSRILQSVRLDSLRQKEKPAAREHVAKIRRAVAGLARDLAV